MMRYCALILALISTAAFCQEKSPEVSAPSLQIVHTGKPSHVADANESSPIKIRGSLSGTLVATAGRVSGFVTIANDSGEELSHIHILLHVPDGFSFSGARVEQDPPAAIQCPPIAGSASILKCELPTDLPTGSERALTLELKAETEQPEQSVDVTIEWTAAKGTVMSSRSLSLGEISVQDSWKFRVTQNPVMLPLITGVLGGLVVALGQTLLALWEKRIEENRAEIAKKAEEARATTAKQEEEQRAAATKKSEEERAHKAATWDMMLPQSHKLAMQHYVHIQSFVRGAISTLDRYHKSLQPGAKPDPEMNELPTRAFLCLLLFARRVQYSTDTVGGLYFKNRTAEEIVARGYYTYRKLYFDRSIQSRGRYEDILQKVSPKARLSELYADMQLSAASSASTAPAPTEQKLIDAIGLGKLLETAFTEFEQQWIKSTALRTKLLPVLKGFAAVMQFEMNRPYRYWYNKASVLEISEPARIAIETLGKDEPFGKDESWESFRKSVKEYMAEATTIGTEDPV